MMQISPPISPSFFLSSVEKSKQNLAAAIHRIGEIVQDASAFQKIYIIALSIIRGINFQCGTNYLPSLIPVLDTACALDFFGFCRLPRLFLYPYTPAALDEFDLLDQLEPILCSNWGQGVVDNKGNRRDIQVRDFAKDQLNAFLEKMTEEDMDFKDEAEVKEILHHWFREVLEAQPINNYDPNALDLQLLSVKLKKNPRLTSIMQGLFVAVDIACIPSFLQAWELINLSPIADYLGRFSLFSWVALQSLDEWIWRLFGAGNAIQAILCARDLWEGKLSPDEARAAKWLMAASVGESVYSLAIVVSTNGPLINALALTAKSLGLAAFFVTPKTTFF